MTETAHPPGGVVTFLLTDIDGSTRAWEEHGEAMAAAVGRHYEILDAAIALHGGVRPVEQGEGDSLVAAFERASDAVAAALAAQLDLAADPWPGAVRLFRTDTPALRAYHAALRATGPNVEPDDLSMLTWVSGKLLEARRCPGGRPGARCSARACLGDRRPRADPQRDPRRAYRPAELRPGAAPRSGRRVRVIRAARPIRLDRTPRQSADLSVMGALRPNVHPFNSTTGGTAMRTTTTRVLALPVAGALLFGAGQLTGRSAAAGGESTSGPGPTTCSTEMLKGRYILSGSGTFGGDLDAIANMVLDGKGTITEGFGTAVVQRVAASETFTAKDGTYSVGANCSGKLKFFTVHKTLGPYDHTHDTDIMVFDGGRQFTLLFLTTELPGAPNVMTEAFRFTAHRV